MLSIGEIENIINSNYHNQKPIREECEETYKAIQKVKGNSFSEKLHVFLYGKPQCANEGCNNRRSFKTTFEKRFGKYCSKQCKAADYKKEEEKKEYESISDKDELQAVVEENRYYQKAIQKRDQNLYETINSIDGQNFGEKLCVYLNDEELECKHPECENRPNFISRKQGFGEFCSNECKSQWRSLEAKITRQCKNCGEEFTFNRNKDKEFCSHKCSNNYDELVEERVRKSRETHNEKYGGIGYASEEIMGTFRDTLEEKYGDRYYTNREKFLETIKSKYDGGLKKGGEFQEKLKKGKRKNLKKFFNNTLVPRLKSEANIEILIAAKEYEGLQNEYPLRCQQCDFKFESNVRSQPLPSCPKCSPRSKPEQQLFEFIDGLLNDKNVIRHDRSVLDSKELDIWIPPLDVAIEYDGIFWHSELNGKKDKDYHLKKTQQCEGKGIQLIHVFGHEWRQKKHVVKSALRHKLGKTENQIYARDCEVREIKTPKKTTFLEQNHLQGAGKSSVKMGLIQGDEIKAVMTFSKPKASHGASKGVELARYASDGSVVGGASRLLTNFIREYNPDKIFTYADRRWSSKGESMYPKIGFEPAGASKPNYHYFRPEAPNTLYHRFGFRKSRLEDKLEYFNPEMTEWENMVLNGFDRIWDCGHLKFEMTV